MKHEEVIHAEVVFQIIFLKAGKSLRMMLFHCFKITHNQTAISTKNSRIWSKISFKLEVKY